MHRITLTLMAFYGMAHVAQAEGRFFCSADDKSARFTVDSGFEGGVGNKLNHFRGALIVKNDGVSPVFHKLTLDSDNLSHDWQHGGELRFQIFRTADDDSGGQAMDMAIAADQPSKSATAFSGTYELTISGGDKPFTASGKASCGAK